MESLLEKLFDTYGDTVLREQGVYSEAKILAALDEIPLDQSTKIDICDLFSNHYFRWSTAAFSVGLHLGRSLTAGPYAPKNL